MKYLCIGSMVPVLQRTVQSAPVFNVEVTELPLQRVRMRWQ